jgi:predicted PurR-regulated permease PerM
MRPGQVDAVECPAHGGGVGRSTLPAWRPCAARAHARTGIADTARPAIHLPESAMTSHTDEADDPAGMPGRSTPLALQLLGGTVLVLLLWALRDVALLCFGAVIFCAALRALSEPLSSRMGLSPRLSLLLVGIFLLLVLACLVWLLGEPIATQLQELRNALPRAWATARDWVQHRPLGQRLAGWMNATPDFSVNWARVAGAASAATGALTHFILVLLLGIYLALDPSLYRRGLLRLVPPPRRPQIGEALDASGLALKHWLLGQGIAMLVVGTSVGIGLALLGMPIAAALGLISGLLEFVPFFGAIASALLAVLLAFTQGPTQALYVGVFFLVLQQIEGNVVIPLVQRWAVHLPPVLSLLAVVVFGSLFGVAGVVLGTPLMVVAMVLVNKLYVEGVLERGQRAPASAPAELG